MCLTRRLVIKGDQETDNRRNTPWNIRSKEAVASSAEPALFSKWLTIRPEIRHQRIKVHLWGSIGVAELWRAVCPTSLE